jgi:hypothetical protein
MIGVATGIPVAIAFNYGLGVTTVISSSLGYSSNFDSYYDRHRQDQSEDDIE